MRASLLAALFLTSACTTIVVRPGPRRAPESEKHDVDGAIVLNGERTRVTWSDGDSFDFKSGRYEGQGTRLVGFNTLEAYGPVHRWGGWTREELYEIAKSGSTLAASQEWECTTQGEPDAYGRLLVDCPKLAREMALAGVGLAYAVRGRPPRLVLDAMHQAQKARRGMWAKGVPDTILTALHSRDEDKEGKYPTAANRVLNTQTGETVLRKHLDNYALCEEVCDGDSCMVYVPYELRYHDQPPCLVGHSPSEN
ncbi:MAG: nuclease [Myxococcales bacterium]|nr:nuclease [Myxococcales bacterium]